MSKPSLDEMLASLVGLRLVGVLVGPAGVHYDMAEAAYDSEPVVHDTILSNAPVHIMTRWGEVLFKTKAYPPFSCQQTLSQILAGREICEVLMDKTCNSLSLSLAGDFVLTLSPSRETANINWQLTRYPDGTSNYKSGFGFVVHACTIAHTPPA